MLTKEIAESFLSYNPETGIFTYKFSTNNRNKAGQEAGSLNHGYKSIMWQGRNYKLHRIVFLLEEGVFPEHQVDHIDGDRSNNRRDNLRKVTNEQNCWNKEAKGVFHRKDLDRYMAYVDHKGKRMHLGYFKSYEEAHTVSWDKRKELKGEYVRAM